MFGYCLSSHDLVPCHINLLKENIHPPVPDKRLLPTTTPPAKTPVVGLVISNESSFGTAQARYGRK